MEELEYLRIKERAWASFKKIPGVHAVAVGGKVTGAKPIGVTSIRVFTVKKKSLSEIPKEYRIPSEFEGVPTDVVEEDLPTLWQLTGADPAAIEADNKAHRPVRGGTQLRHPNSGRGTLGCVLEVQGDPNRGVAVTNSHVFYRVLEQPNREDVGQPEAKESCTGCCSDMIGKVRDAFRGSFADPNNPGITRWVDLALVDLNPGTKWLAEVHEIGLIKGAHHVTSQEASTHAYQVKKRGKTTRVTGGYVSDIGKSGNLQVVPGMSSIEYIDCLRIAPNANIAHPSAPNFFSFFGDSGSAVLNDSNEIIGILFGGSLSGLFSIVIPIQSILDASAHALESEKRIQLSVPTANTYDDVRITPMSATQSVSTVASGHAPWHDVVEIENDLRASRWGNWYADLYLRHFGEIRHLIETNRRLATVWHRSGGAEFFQCLVRVFREPSARVPSLVNGRSHDQCIGDFISTLRRYGSAALCSDLDLVQPTLPRIGGLTYQEIIRQLHKYDFETPSLA
jgi:hypothetical protein